MCQLERNGRAMVSKRADALRFLQEKGYVIPAEPEHA